MVSLCTCIDPNSVHNVVPYRAFYRPQRSCGQGYVFTRVCDSVHRGRGLRAGPPGTWQGEPPPGTWQGEPPWIRQTPHPPGSGREIPPPRPGRENPRPGRPLPPDQACHPPPDLAGRTSPPRREKDCSIRSMSGRYASYWNAFLFFFKLRLLLGSGMGSLIFTFPHPAVAPR